MNALRLAVVGARGMLGRAVMRLAPVVFADRPVELAALDLAEVDITSRDSIHSSLPLRAATMIVNCAAYTDVERAEAEEARATAVNGTGVRNLALLARETGAHLLHISTDFVFAGCASAPISPEAVPHPVSAYGRSKRAGEMALAEVGGTWSLVRTAWLFGYGGKNFVETMLALAERDGRLAVVCDQVGSPTFADDLARALLLLLRARALGVYHATGWGCASWHQFACEIVKQAGLRVPVEPILSAEAAERFGLKAVRPAYSVLDGASLAAAIGASLPPWQDGLARYLAGRQSAGQ